MKELVIGDMHFGVKSNSIEWLTKQCELIDKQISKIIDEYNLDRIVFLGDLFDVRYSINQQVASEVKKTIRKMSARLYKKNPNAYIVFIAGNHDYYSPVEDAAEYNAYETVFGPEFTKTFPNIYFVTKEPLCKDDSLFLPWYWTDNTDHFDDLLYRYEFGVDVLAVYCHADLSIWPGVRIASLKGIPVYAGHIHFITEDNICNLHNIGAACALTFGDVNQDRFLYILEDFKIVERIKNETTPKFVRLYNEEIFNDDPSIYDNSFVQLCINKTNIEKATFTDQIKMLKAKYVDGNIRVHLIDDDEINIDNVDISSLSFSPNINEYIQTNLPSHLNTKFDYLKNKINTK